MLHATSAMFSHLLIWAEGWAQPLGVGVLPLGLWEAASCRGLASRHSIRAAHSQPLMGFNCLVWVRLLSWTLDQRLPTFQTSWATSDPWATSDRWTTGWRPLL